MRDPIVPQFTAAEYLAWEADQSQKYELHRGFVFLFAGGTIEHDRIAFNIRVLLASAIDAHCRTFGSDVKIRVAADLYYYPDVAVVCEEVAHDASIVERPTIVVEVLARSTKGYDIVEKRAAYRSISSLNAYVIVHTEQRRVEVDRRAPGGAWRTETVDDGTVAIAGREHAIDSMYASSPAVDRR